MALSLINLNHCLRDAKSRSSKFQAPTSREASNFNIQSSALGVLKSQQSRVCCLFSKNARKNQMEVLRLAVKFAPLVGQLWFRSGDHAKKVLGFFRFLYATANNVAKVFLRYALACFAIVGADACSATDELIDQAVVRWITWNPFGKPHDCFTKYGRRLFEIEWVS